MTVSAFTQRWTVVAGALATSVLLAAQGHDVVIPYIPPPQDNATLQDPVTRLTKRIEAGAVKLAVEPVGGTLRSLLRELAIPVSSQTLVFSKTSLQHEFIKPRSPRAIYFNDDTYVGFVPDGNVLEISSVDPEVGAVFYTLGRRSGARPFLVTDARCLQCHQIPATLGVSGHLMRSVFVRSDGSVASGEPAYLTDDRSPFTERWGGWFVTGTVANTSHMGNAILPAGQRAATFDGARGSAITDVRALFDYERYLAGASDVVALMVLGHQVRLHNLIARLSHTARSNGARQTSLVDGPVLEQIDELLRAMLFVDAMALAGPIRGATSFAADFERRGIRDGKGRSLRQFDLDTRLFKFRCSYLIYSQAFLGLPSAVKAEIYERLRAILAGQTSESPFRSLAPTERQAVLEILEETHADFRASRPNGPSR
jgi:hypothetical protein